MKKILLISFSLALCLNIFAQNTQISLNQGYTNQSFYSIQNGEVLNISNEDWDIAFSTETFSSTIRTNDGKGVELYTYPLGDISAWDDINNSDINNLSELMFNSDTSWEYGAFDINQTGGLDYGWGVYNMQTHHLIGDSLFLIKTINQNWKKLCIESKISGEYQIRYADLDGSNEVNMSIPALNYSDKNFIYYSLEMDQMIDREPNKNDWDITFTKYLTLYPTQQGAFMPYSVTGTFNNAGVEVAQADNISSPLTYNDYSLHPFSTEINTIGYDWKLFQGSYIIVDDRCYFVRDKAGNIWRLTFVDFEGSSTGNIEFNTELIQSTDIAELTQINSFAIYPNPVTITEELTLIYELSSQNTHATVRIYDFSGRERYVSELNNYGLLSHTINIKDFKPGIYMISINVDGIQKTERVVIN
tara:strand:+ start:39590 stop:40840 length:1251 start_codon:yes stop_codon:yes gene_type:complete